LTLKLSKYAALIGVTGGLLGGWLSQPRPVQALTTQATVKLTRKTEVAPVAPVEKLPDEINTTGSKGNLTIDAVSDLNYQTQVIDQAITLAPTSTAIAEQVSDRRAQPDGWELTVQPSGLRQGSHELQSQLDWPTTGELKTVATNVSRPPQQVSPGKLLNQRANPLLAAKAGQGIETWALVMATKTDPVTLQLPAQKLVAGHYRGTLTWQLVSAPTN